MYWRPRHVSVDRAAEQIDHLIARKVPSTAFHGRFIGVPGCRSDCRLLLKDGDWRRCASNSGIVAMREGRLAL